LILLLLIGGIIAPESWYQKVFSKLWLARPPRPGPAESQIETPQSRNGEQPKAAIPPQPSIAPARPSIASANPGKAGIFGGSPGNRALPSISLLSAAKGASDVSVLHLKADVVRSPEYELSGGPLKEWVPRPWIQISVTFSTKRDFDRLAVLYEMDDSHGSFADAIAYVNVRAGESLQAVVYLIPSRSRLMVIGGTGVSLDSYRAALIYRGSVLAIAESGHAMRTAMDREHGFLRPRSLTPFAPLAWDAFLPDSGFAEEADLQPATTRPTLTKTSPGK
jgi:hypothetical protein